MNTLQSWFTHNTMDAMVVLGSGIFLLAWLIWMATMLLKVDEEEESKTEESKTEESKTEESKTEESKTEESKTEE